MIDYVKKIADVKEYTEQAVKKSRFEHSVRVAEMCARLCRYYNLNEEKGYLAGIGHDMCKDMDPDNQIDLAVRDGHKILDFEIRHPSLLHGRASAVLLKEKFLIYDEDILEAVANHTSGAIGMCDLSKCLFLADKIEPGRPQSTKEYRERLFKMSLKDMFYSVFQENYEYICKKGCEVYPGTEDMLEYYKTH